MSVFERHPFVVTWWENADDNGENTDSKEENADVNYKAQVLYVMIYPQQGWTQSVMARQSVFTDQVAWLSGPFGLPYRLEEYGTVILFASGNGIFAQLPLLKRLAEGLKCSASKTRRVKLVWQTDIFHKQLEEWMHSILRDDEVGSEVSDGLNSVSRSTAYISSFWIFAFTCQHPLESSKRVSMSRTIRSTE